MKIVIAPDSYKDSLEATNVSEIIAQAIHDVEPSIRTVLKPMADGGEGTLNSLFHRGNMEKIYVYVTGARGEKINTYYGISDDHIAFIEMALIAGLEQISLSERNPYNTTSYGLGEVMEDAYRRGCRQFVIGIGGSATNDGGLGMLQALGMKAFNNIGEEVSIFGKDISDIHTVDVTALNKWQTEVEIKVASDVNNPLCGKQGATYVYGPQKGLPSSNLAQFDQAMDRYGTILENAFQNNLKKQEGAGAAGGIGFALLCLHAKLKSGAKLIAQMIELEQELEDTTFVITGEGKTDEQTLYGKAPSYVATLAKQYNVPTVLLSGSISKHEKLSDQFAGCFSIVNGPLSLEECMNQAETLLYEQTKQIMSLILSFYK
ncbi:glycerate kinase [Pseudogracilibacillus sp. ICA-222130]|uniref:glycerate kinase n=1 Tax=Pseudogracilibacillus sp. ICA-222130 TaxID=3134655 RepID=UPI0030BF9808